MNLEVDEMKVKIEGMTCDNCTRTIKRLFSKIEGVNEVKVDLESGTAEVEASSPISEKVFSEALEDTAYEVTGIEL